MGHRLRMGCGAHTGKEGEGRGPPTGRGAYIRAVGHWATDGVREGVGVCSALRMVGVRGGLIGAPPGGVPVGVMEETVTAVCICIWKFHFNESLPNHQQYI